MKRTHSLEEERQAILQRMHSSRAEYARLLRDDSDQDHAAHPETYSTHIHHAGTDNSHSHDAPFFSHGSDHASTHYYGENSIVQAASAALQWMKKHPILCAIGVAAIVAAGPKRIVRQAVKGGTALSFLTLRNTKNSDAITLLLSTAANYLKRKPLQSHEGKHVKDIDA